MALLPVDADGAALRALRGAGLRVTKPRRAVLAWLAEHPHSTVDTIGTGVRAQLGSVSTQAIYDVLAVCTDAGLLRRIEPAGHPARFERRVGDNHHHLVCRRCGRTDDIDCAIGQRPCLTPSDEHGFALDEAEVVFWGLCPACLADQQIPHDEETRYDADTIRADDHGRLRYPGRKR
jgi:Fur family ferric uptake transcriptional regulator